MTYFRGRSFDQLQSRSLCFSSGPSRYNTINACSLREAYRFIFSSTSSFQKSLHWSFSTCGSLYSYLQQCCILLVSALRPLSVPQALSPVTRSSMKMLLPAGVSLAYVRGITSLTASESSKVRTVRVYCLSVHTKYLRSNSRAWLSLRPQQSNSWHRSLQERARFCFSTWHHENRNVGVVIVGLGVLLQ